MCNDYVPTRVGRTDCCSPAGVMRLNDRLGQFSIAPNDENSENSNNIGTCILMLL